MDVRSTFLKSNISFFCEFFDSIIFGFCVGIVKRKMPAQSVSEQVPRTNTLARERIIENPPISS